LWREEGGWKTGTFKDDALGMPLRQSAWY